LLQKVIGIYYSRRCVGEAVTAAAAGAIYQLPQLPLAYLPWYVMMKFLLEACTP